MLGQKFIALLNIEQNAAKISIEVISIIATVIMTQHVFLLICGTREESNLAGFCTRAAMLSPNKNGINMGKIYFIPKYTAAAYTNVFIILKKLEDEFILSRPSHKLFI